MRAKFIALAAAAAVSAISAPAMAAPTFNVTLTSPVIAIPGDNDFIGQLAGLGMVNESKGAKVDIVEGGNITFEFLGSESGYDDFFKFLGTTRFTENQNFVNNFAGPTPSVTINGVSAGLLDILFGSTTVTARTATAAGGDAGFAVFMPGATVTNFSSNVIYFGYDDDNRINPDDNHDDFIVRATISAVPEASTWAMMIAGFAVVGLAVRRRSQSARVSFS